MKELKIYYVLFGLAFMLIANTLTSCKGSDNGEPDISKPVVVDENNKASDGSTIISIDDYNFYKDYVKYSVESGHLIVSGFDQAGFKGIAQIPSQITYKGNTYEVLGIGAKAFYNCKSLTSITLPSSITTIEESAFLGCVSLPSVKLPNNLRKIGKSAFASCDNLNDITIPESVTLLISGAFRDCIKLTKITIPKSVKSIEAETFSGCRNLTSITIQEGVSAIYKGAFEYCSSLSSITIPQSVVGIFDQAFHGCTSLNSITCLATTPPAIISNVFQATNSAPIYVPEKAVNAYKIAEGWMDYADRIKAIPE